MNLPKTRRLAGPPNRSSLYDKLSEKRKDRQAGIPPSSRRSCQFGPLDEPDWLPSRSGEGGVDLVNHRVGVPSAHWGDLRRPRFDSRGLRVAAEVAEEFF